MDESDLNKILDEEVENSVGYQGTVLSNTRVDSMKYYLGEPFGNEVDGRSHYVSRDTQDTIEWIMPMLMEVLTEGHSLAQFAPQNPDDVEDAETETDFVNYTFFRKNRGYVILHNFIKDALINKVGIMKHWFDESEVKTRETYRNLDQFELAELFQDPDLEVDEDTLEQDDTGTFTVEVIRTVSKGIIKIKGVPPEEFVVSPRTEWLHDSDFCGHIFMTTPSDLRKMGIPEKDIRKILKARNSNTESTRLDTSVEKIARHLDSETNPAEQRSRTDEAMIDLTLEDLFIRVDWDDDGIAELRQIMRVGNVILVNQEVDENPFSAWSPILMPHKFVGRSVADLVMDIQEIKSNLIRSMLDNINLQNNGRYGVLESMVNMEDLLTSRPLGLVRMKVPNAVTRLDSPQLPPEAFNMLGFLDSTREERTGVSKSTQNLDSKALSSNHTTGAVTGVMDAALGRIKLIAHVLAETGLRDIMISLHRLIRMNVPEEQIFSLTGKKFKNTNPSNWKDRDDVMIFIGNSIGSQSVRFTQLQMLTQDIAQIVQGGGAGRLVDEQKIFNLIEEKAKLMGYQDATRFVNDPSTLPEPEEEGPTPEQQMVMLKAEELKLKVAKLKAEMELDMEKLKLEKQKFEHERALDDAKFQLEAQELELERSQGRAVKIGK